MWVKVGQIIGNLKFHVNVDLTLVLESSLGIITFILKELKIEQKWGLLLFRTIQILIFKCILYFIQKLIHELIISISKLISRFDVIQMTLLKKNYLQVSCMLFQNITCK